MLPVPEPFELVHDVNVVPVGALSTTLTLVAAVGPLFVTVII